MLVFSRACGFANGHRKRRERVEISDINRGGGFVFNGGRRRRVAPPAFNATRFGPLRLRDLWVEAFLCMEIHIGEMHCGRRIRLLVAFSKAMLGLAIDPAKGSRVAGRWRLVLR